MFLHDTRSGSTERISIAGDQTEGRHVATPSDPGPSGFAWGCNQSDGRGISASGRFVVFVSSFDNLVPNDANGVGGIFVKDRETGRVERISVGSNGLEGTTWALFNGTITPSGRYVIFASCAQNLFAGDSPSDNRLLSALPGGSLLADCDVDAFLHDRRTGATELISQAVGREEAHGWSVPYSQSADGRFVSFASDAPDLVARDANAALDVFVRDRGLGLGVGGFLVPASHGRLPVAGSADLSRGSVVRMSDTGHDAAAGSPAGADLIAATVAYRPQLSDLYIQIDLAHMPGPRGTGTAGNPALVYGMGFTVDGTRYEVRAQGLGLTARFGLFRCASACTEVAELQGGYGTVGESIVATVPRDALRLDDGTTIADLAAFSSLGTYHAGAMTVLDAVRPGR